MKTLKFTLITVILFAGTGLVLSQNHGVAINTDGSQAHPSAMFDVKSSTGGFLAPRMTLIERNGLVNPATGLLIYQTNNTPGFYYYDGSAWQKVVGGFDDDWTISGNNMYNMNTGNVGIGTSSPGAKLEVAGRIWQTGLGASVIIGENAGNSDDLSSNANVFIGTNTGQSNTTGENNIAIGGQALLGNTSGSKNIAIGNAALWFNGGAEDNISIGYSSCANSTTGSFNTVVGTWAFKSFANSSYNTVFGFNALGDFEAIPWALGYYSGDRLTAIGYEALFNNQQGIRNTAIGYSAMYENKTGSNNTAVGYGSGATATNLSNTGAFGSGAVPTTNNQIVLGNTSVLQVKTSGGITVGNTTVTEPGTIRFQGGHFEGWNGSAWVQLDN
jgi:hypothetical protein